MRRKIFFALLLIVAMLFLLDSFNIPLKPMKPVKSLVCGKTCEYVAKVKSVQYKEENSFRIEAEIAGIDGREAENVKVLLGYYKNLERPWDLIGEEISFRGVLEEARGQRNPHCFDYSKYLKSRNIFSVGTIKSFKICEGSLSLKEKYEKWLFEKRYLFERELSPETKGIIMGVLFGDTSYLDEDVYRDFKNNGTAHILAVSGIHVGILYKIYKKLSGNRHSTGGLLILGLIFFTYGTLSLWSPSVLRAELMVIMNIVARKADMRYDMLTAVSVAGLILIIGNPYIVFGAGFQMSFLAIISISFLRPVISRRVPDFLAVVLAVNIGLIPYQIYQFNYVSLLSLIANIPIIYLAGYFLPAAICGFVLFTVSGKYWLIKPIVEGLGFLVIKVNRLSTLGGNNAVEVIRPPLWVVLAAASLLFFLSSETFAIMKKRGQWKKAVGCLCIIALLVVSFQAIAYNPITHDDIVFVDVGQGDCLHIRAGKKNVLIDGGGSVNYNVGENILKPYLLKNGVGKLDMAVATHEHTDHFKGIEELTEVFSVDKVMTRMSSGDIIEISDEVRIETLWPETISEGEGQELNSQCSVFIVHFKEYKILITGDLDEAGENSIIEKYLHTDKLKADILKIGHHGSNTSTSEKFLEAVNPSYAVIQVGKNNYGHPSPKVIEKCQKKGIMVFRNDYNGAVAFSFKKGRIYCHLSIN